MNKHSFKDIFPFTFLSEPAQLGILKICCAMGAHYLWSLEKKVLYIISNKISS